MSSNLSKNENTFFVGALLAIFFILGLIFYGLSFGYRHYAVWSASMQGQAELNQATYNRQIKVKEAEAALESSKYFAQAEVERAKGVAEANRIIGKSLEGNEAYLRYLWVHGIQETKDQIIYVPTEANLPILEAGRNKRGDVK